jgi:hypothetical protein
MIAGPSRSKPALVLSVPDIILPIQIQGAAWRFRRR